MLISIHESGNSECDSSFKDFLLLDEVAPQQHVLPVEDKKDCMVKIQDLTCYWDKVRIIVGSVSLVSIYTSLTCKNP